MSFKAGSVLDMADILGDLKINSALDSALYHCLDEATNEKYLAALHKQVLLLQSKSLCVLLWDWCAQTCFSAVADGKRKSFLRRSKQVDSWRAVPLVNS